MGERELIGVYGAGGCGRGILPLIRNDLIDTSTTLVFIDDALAGKTINGHAVVAWEAFCATSAEQRSVCLAVANSSVRQRLFERCNASGIALRAARANNVVEMDNVWIGEGACLSPFVTLTSNIKIGRCFHANLHSYVEHDCVIGDFVTFAPGVKCNGNVHVEDHAYIGAGAIIKQGVEGRPLRIGRNAIVGMGAIVTRDVPEGTTVVGNPARNLTRADRC